MSFTPYVSNQTVSSEFVSNGIQELVESGSALNNSIGISGQMNVSSGGLAISTEINDSGWMNVLNGGLASSTQIHSGGGMDVESGGLASSTEIYDNGNMSIGNGGLASSTEINSGGYIYVSSGGVASSTEIYDNGIMLIGNGGLASSTEIHSSGGMDVAGGGLASSTQIHSDGEMDVYRGGSASSTQIHSDGWMHVHRGGLASSTEISAGNMNVFDGGLASSTSISGGNMNVFGEGIASSTEIYGGGKMNISSGGLASSTQIHSRGRMDISSGGLASSTVIHSDGWMYVYGGANSTTISGGLMIVFGEASSTSVSAGNMNIHDGGLASSTQIHSGGRMGVFDRGSASSTEIHSGGWMDVHSGGLASSTSVSGGWLNIHDGGLTSSTEIHSGGRMNVFDGGLASSTEIHSGGSMNVFNTGLASSTEIHSSGSMYVDSGGSAVNTTVNGLLTVSNGGILGGNLSINISSEGRVTVGNASGMNDLTSVNYVLTESLGNDAFITVEHGTLAMNSSSYSIDVSNAAYNDYILIQAEDISMDGKSISIERGDENVNLTIGSSYGFNNGDEFSIRVNNFDNYGQLTFVYNAKFADDDWQTLDEDTYKLDIAADATGVLANEWVGLGDPVDYRKLDLDHSGAYNFTISNIESTARMTVYELVGKPGKEKLKKLKNITVKAGAGSIDNLLMNKNSTYYLQVEATGWKKAQNTPYAIDITGTAFDSPFAIVEDNVWWSAMGNDGFGIDMAGTGIDEEWVGLGDAVDYRKLDLSSSGTGSYNFMISGLENSAKMTIYELVKKDPSNEGEVGKLKRLKTITVKPKPGIDRGYINSLLLDDGKEYYLQVEAPGHAKAQNTGYSIAVTTNADKDPNPIDTDAVNDADDNWEIMDKDLYKLVIDADGNGGFINEWVGLEGFDDDALDYRKIDLSYSGFYNFTISSLDNAARMTIFEKVGDSKLKRLKTITVNPKSAAKGLGSIDGLLLDGNDTKEYYLQVEATGYKKGLSTNYDITVTGEVFDNTENGRENNSWNDGEVGSISLGGSTLNEWVGFDDATDYWKINPGNSRSCNFEISGIENSARMTVYELVKKNSLDEGKLKKLKNVTVKSGTGSIDGLVLDGSKEYYLQVEATGHAKGLNTDYKVEFTGYETNNTNDNWGDAGVRDLLYGLGGLIENQWVGLGDAADWYRFDIASNAKNYQFNLVLDTPGSANIRLYKEVSGSLNAVALDTDNIAAGLVAGIYAVEISSADGGSGGMNTRYSLAMVPVIT